MRFPRTWLVLATAAATFAGCRGAPRPTAADLADDFSIAITILPGAGAPTPCWLIVGPDGVLHGALGERTESSMLPGAVRQLSRRQVRTLHDMADHAGLLSASPPGLAAPPMAPTVEGAGALVDTASMGRRSTRAVAADDAAFNDIRALAVEMRRLAWAD